MNELNCSYSSSTSLSRAPVAPNKGNSGKAVLQERRETDE